MEAMKSKLEHFAEGVTYAVIGIFFTLVVLLLVPYVLLVRAYEAISVMARKRH